jgi:hypothetical protein
MTLLSKSRLTAGAATTAVAAVTAAVALAVPPPPSGTFTGTTSQTKLKEHNISLTTDANGHVASATINWQAKCKKKGKFWTAKTTINGGSDGFAQTGDVFQQRGSYTGKVGGGIKGVVTATISGSFTDNDNASGRWSAKVTVKRKHKVIDRCKLTKLKWHATRTQ